MNFEPANHLDKQHQRALALWAANCAEHVLAFFEENRPQDDRPRRAIEVARSWARGALTCGEARAAALAAHAAARETNDIPARQAARAAGHAAATAHMPRHTPVAAQYAIKAAIAAAPPATAEQAAAGECDWQRQHRPAHLTP